MIEYRIVYISVLFHLCRITAASYYIYRHRRCPHTSSKKILDVPKVRHYLNCYRRFYSVSYLAKTHYRNFTWISPEWALLWDQFVWSYWENRLGEPCLVTGPHSGNSSMSLWSSVLRGIKLQHRILKSVGRKISGYTTSSLGRTHYQWKQQTLCKSAI